MKELPDLTDQSAQLLKLAEKRWGNQIPAGVLADLSTALLAIADERFEEAERLLIELGGRIQ